MIWYQEIGKLFQEVIPGKKTHARQIGFKTANLKINEYCDFVLRGVHSSKLKY